MADKKTVKNIFNLVYLSWQKMFTQNHLNVQVFIVGVRVCCESLCIHLRPAGALSWPEKQVYRALGLPNAFHVQSFTHNNTSCQVRVCWLLPGSQTSRDWSETGSVYQLAAGRVRRQEEGRQKGEEGSPTEKEGDHSGAAPWAHLHFKSCIRPREKHSQHQRRRSTLWKWIVQMPWHHQSAYESKWKSAGRNLLTVIWLEYTVTYFNILRRLKT